MKSFEQNLRSLAQVSIRVGLGLQSGQELVITAPVEALDLVRLITEEAYQAGASLVTTLYTDDEANLARFKYAPADSFSKAATWLYEGMAEAYQSGAARLAIAGTDPMLLREQNPEQVAQANRATSLAGKRAMELITGLQVNWSIVSFATPSWAKAVFPDDPQDVAIAKLWDAIFAASRIDTPDPLAAWQAHNRRLRERVDFLNAKRYAALHFRGPGTDLRLGLADDHKWGGGADRAKNGALCLPNIPTEEVFTTPHKDRIEGQVSSTKPLSYGGTLLDGIRLRFERGRIVEASAGQGQEVLTRVLETDEGARSLGEVALVPHSSPISQSGILFYNTLFDENAASHIALGQAYPGCMIGGTELSPAELAAKGANHSLIHIDWMIGSGEVDVDGISQSGAPEPLMRQGEWVS